MQQEQPAEHRQTITIVNGKAFITTQLVRQDINGKEFITFEKTVPYEGSIEKLKQELYEVKTKEQERHNKVISEIDKKLAEIQTNKYNK